MHRWRAVVAWLLSWSTLITELAVAQSEPPPRSPFVAQAPPTAPVAAIQDEARKERPQALPPLGSVRDCAFPCYFHTFAALGFGRGVRFNNPYRLQTPLGSRAESLSATAPYLDFRLGAQSGDPYGLHHGISLGVAWALDGIPQQVITPGYQVAYKVGSRHWLRASAGPAIVLQPDANVGLELEVAWVLMVRAGLGAYLGISQATFWGAATQESPATIIPILAAHAGVSVHYEVLP